MIDYSGIWSIGDPAAIKLLKRADALSAWTDVTADFTHNSTNRTFTKTGETSFSEFAIGDNGENPTAVEIAYFDAAANDLGVRLNWETVLEIDLLGFYVYRADSETASPVRITENLIPLHWPVTSLGGSYFYQDQTAAPGATYYYMLEVVHIDGATQLYGPVGVTLVTGYAPVIYLPLVIGGG